jgi:hypothetical protein
VRRLIFWCSGQNGRVWPRPRFTTFSGGALDDSGAGHRSSRVAMATGRATAQGYLADALGAGLHLQRDDLGSVVVLSTIPGTRFIASGFLSN